MGLGEWGVVMGKIVSGSGQARLAAPQKRLGPQGDALVATGAPKLGKSSELLISGAWNQEETEL